MVHDWSFHSPAPPGDSSWRYGRPFGSLCTGSRRLLHRKDVDINGEFPSRLFSIHRVLHTFHTFDSMSVFPRQHRTATIPTQGYLEESNVISILSITGAFAFAALVVVALRIYVRTCMLRFVGLDDWSMILAALMAIGTFICLCGESAYGMGRHRQWQQPWMLEPYFGWLFAHGVMVMLGVILVKISVAFFLMRIMVQKSWKIFLWCSIGKHTEIHSRITSD
jgi:hypothetical protein